MFQALVAAAAAGLLAGQGPPAAPGPSGAEVAACRTAADQPICLLRLVARSRGHQPYDANIEIGYAPKVLAAIGPEPSPVPASSFLESLQAPSRAAVQALIADHAGAKPAEALAPIRAISAAKAASPVQQAAQDAIAASRRVQAYRILWNASRGEPALPIASRPSGQLARATLEAWDSELPKAGDMGEAKALAAAFRQAGDPQAAARIAAPPELSGFDQVSALLDSGKLDEAAHAIDTMKPSPGPVGAVEVAMARMDMVSKAMEAGRTDIGLHFAEAQLNAWFAEVTDPAHRGSAHSGADVPSSLVLVAQFAPRAEAVKWTERMDAAARQATPMAAATSAYAAAHAWTMLGEPDRARAVLALWPTATPTEATVQACILGLLQFSAECQKSPGMLLAIFLKTAPLDASWDELSPITGQRTLARHRAARGLAGVDADLAKATTAEQRFRILQDCTEGEAEFLPSAIAAVCARRLASQPAPELSASLPGWTLSYDQRRLDGALNVAGQAAKSQDLKTLHEMLDLSFELAARMPDEQVNDSVALQVVAIAELREQGRL